MRKCPECKFILTENSASCRFCGHLLGGTHTNDAQTLAYEPGVDLTSHDPESMRPQPVVRRAGEGLAPAPEAPPRPRVMMPPPMQALGPASGAPRSRDGSPPAHPVMAGPPRQAPVPPPPTHARASDFYSLSASERSAPGPMSDGDAGSRWQRIAIATGGLVLALSVGGFFYLRSPSQADPVKAEAVAPTIAWERVGPPTVPFTAELPGPSKGVSLRPFEDRPTVALQAELDQAKAFVVGAFDLPEGALAFGPDAYLRATAERIATVRMMTLGDGLGTDRREGRVYDASMSNAGGGGGWVHLLVAGQRVYFAAVFVPSDAASVRPLYDRMAQSLQPA